jgi:phosphopantetheine adenylyltransferase
VIRTNKDGKEPSHIYEYEQAVIAPGKFNPPTAGHKRIFDELKFQYTNNNYIPYIVIIDVGRVEKQRPLSGEQRENYIRKMIQDDNIRYLIAKNPYEAVQKMAWELKVAPVGYVVGTDRDVNYEHMCGRVFGTESWLREHVNTYEILRKGQAAVEETDSLNVSSSLVRHLVQEGQEEEFVKVYQNSGLSSDDAIQLYHDIQTGMNNSG